MAWFGGKVTLGNFPDFSEAVNKLQESVKSIEKNFDSALGLEEKSASGAPSTEATSALWPVMSFMGSKSESMESDGSPMKKIINAEDDLSSAACTVEPASGMIENGEKDLNDHSGAAEKEDLSQGNKPLENSIEYPVHMGNENNNTSENSEPVVIDQPLDGDTKAPEGRLEHVEPPIVKFEVSEDSHSPRMIRLSNDSMNAFDKPESISNPRSDEEETQQRLISNQMDELSREKHEEAPDIQHNMHPSGLGFESQENDLSTVPNAIADVKKDLNMTENDVKCTIAEESYQISEAKSHLETSTRESPDRILEIGKLQTELKTMETALQGAARQAQLKADEIAKLMNDNEHLRALIEDLKKKSNYDAELESLREEYHQRVSGLERKLYALTKERDTLRREQTKKSDAAALLKEKDEIINQVMAEGEELSKKQAAQEGTIRKLRAQIRELEEEKKGLSTKLQVEENKVESVMKDKSATEKLLQETIEKHQNELAVQKEYYVDALAAAKEAEALAEVRANNEARTELESRLRETEERESLLVQALEELRQTLSRKEQQAVFREEMLRRDIEDLQQRYQASERRCEELVSQVPESTRPLLRQIEAMQETAARRAEAWAVVERSLNSRLQEAETRAAASEEKERSINERLSQTLSRVNVLEAQISCLRAEQTQLSKSLEKERQRAAENRQEYLAVKEEAETLSGRALQLEMELKEVRQKHKTDLQNVQVQKELLQQEVEKEKAARLDLEKTSRSHSTIIEHVSPANLGRKLSDSSSLGNAEESFYLQSSLDSSENYLEKRNISEASLSPYHMKSMTPSTYESALRQKEGELASYMSRLASMESIRDSLAEELVKMTEQCERLRSESALLPGIRAELEALRRRHSAALELMGERDEELEELRADVVDLKEMYREQVNLLVNKLQIQTPSLGLS